MELSFTSVADVSDIHADELIRLAEDDAGTAKVLLGTQPPILGAAAYHAEQAAEKAVKAALVKLGLAYARTHDVHALVAALPTGHPYTANGVRLANTTPWANAFRYTISTPPSASNIGQALSAALDLAAQVANDLPSPATPLTIGLAATSSTEWRLRRIVALNVDPRLITDAVASPQSSDTAVVVAFRLIAETSVHQPEYDLNEKRMDPTGRTLYQWAGVHHVRDILRVGGAPPDKQQLHLNALKLDDVVRAHPKLQTAFAALLIRHQGKSP